jgi:hypothetical protein
LPPCPDIPAQILAKIGGFPWADPGTTLATHMVNPREDGSATLQAAVPFDQEATMITLGSGTLPTLQNQVPQHHHRHQRGTSQSGSWWSKASQGGATETAASDDETGSEPAAASPTVTTGGINILA